MGAVTFMTMDKPGLDLPEAIPPASTPPLAPAPLATAPLASTLATPSWTEQDGELVSLWEKGIKPEEIAVKLKRSAAAVMTRAARLGLQRRYAPGRKPKKLSDLGQSHEKMRMAAKLNAQLQTVAPLQAHRICLMCLKRFQSAGRHNRICVDCKDSAEYKSAASVLAVDVQQGEF